MHDVAAGMSYLHAQNYLHGDLRSPNVFMVAQDAGRLGAKIGDFGYAKLLGEQTATGRGWGPVGLCTGCTGALVLQCVGDWLAWSNVQMPAFYGPTALRGRRPRQRQHEQ